MNVPVELMACDDSSGVFTLRLINEIDPSVSDGPPVVATTWTITGGSGYNTVLGHGDAELPEPMGASTLVKATGTITDE